ncbi:MAG: hypothetical protein M1839_002095 [Geoglossum umbratile]|nr:MAG: hypothetical protein M1839_002095 [Geoglossum umbratile]
MHVDQMTQELARLLERNEDMDVVDTLPELLEEVDDLEDIIKWHEDHRKAIKSQDKLLKICHNSFIAIQGCVEDMHDLEVGIKEGEERWLVNMRAQHAMWNIACSFKGLQQAHAEPALLTEPGRLILNSYLAKTVRLAALLLEIHGYGDWANAWREVLEEGHINTIDFEPLKHPSETNISDTRLCAILGLLAVSPSSSPPPGVTHGGSPPPGVTHGGSLPPGFADGATPTIIPGRAGGMLEWNAKALRESPKVRRMFEIFNAGAPNPGSIVDEGSINVGWRGGPDPGECAAQDDE